MKLVNFGPSQNGCPASYAIAGTPKNDDLQHPVTASNIMKINVHNDYLLFYPRPNVG